VSFSGGGGSGAAALASISGATVTTYPIASITVNSGGAGYSTSSPPLVTLSGGGGSGATATATVSTVATGLFSLDHITVTAAGSGYTSNPTVDLSGGGGTGAAAVAQISGGTKYGKVWLMTSLAQTKTGARSMVQMEVASPVLGWAPGGALTLDGPNPIMDAMPNSNPFHIDGTDANTCHEDKEPDHPAILGFDDPGADPPTSSVEIIKASLPKPDHYVGSGGTPSVENGYNSLGETMGTPAGLDSVMSAIYNKEGAVHYNSATVGSFNPAATTIHSITHVDGDLDLGGNVTGNGILVVTGTMTLHGDFAWNGIVYVVGDGHFVGKGGGNLQINGSLWVAKTWDDHTSKNLLEELGSPTMHWNGGGGNGIYYDHCLVTDLMNAIPTDTLYSTKPLKVLSFRVLPY